MIAPPTPGRRLADSQRHSKNRTDHIKIQSTDLLRQRKTLPCFKNNTGYHATGIASWYGTKFQNYLTSSGEKYDMFKMTAASKTLRIPCYARHQFRKWPPRHCESK